MRLSLYRPDEKFYNYLQSILQDILPSLHSELLANVENTHFSHFKFILKCKSILCYNSFAIIFKSEENPGEQNKR